MYLDGLGNDRGFCDGNTGIVDDADAVDVDGKRCRPRSPVGLFPRSAVTVQVPVVAVVGVAVMWSTAVGWTTAIAAAGSKSAVVNKRARTVEFISLFSVANCRTRGMMTRYRSIA